MPIDAVATQMVAPVACIGADEAEAPAASWGTSHLDAHDVESLLLNFDIAPRVTTRAQLFVWTQGLLQNLIPHCAVICTLRRSSSPAFLIDLFSTTLGTGHPHAEAVVRDPAPAAVLADAWRQHRLLPLRCHSGDYAAIAGSTLGRELRRVRATELLVHGSHDAAGEVLGLCVFACRPGATGRRELYLLQLIAPLLQAAWVRSQTRILTEGARATVTTGCVLTERERGILHWVYLGKSNAEIGAILNISALTVKNHVQKILRKLNVVNRAQAVGRALDARIIKP